jgi:hypothetical protein
VNGSVNYTVTATSLGGFGGSVTVTCGGTLAGVDITCGNITIPAGSSGSTTLTVKTSGLTSPGNFQVTANGQGSGLNRSASAGIAVFDMRPWPIGGTVDPSIAAGGGDTGTFTLNVNGFSKSANYCSVPILFCEELGPGQPAVTDFGTITQALINAINSDSSSPVTAGLFNGGLALTAKNAGVFLRITSSDNMQSSPFTGFIGGPSVYTLDTASLVIAGPPGDAGSDISTFSLFVSTNGSNFLNSGESVAYCNPNITPLPGCEEVAPPAGVYSASDVQQALANAFNSDGASPVRAAINNNGLTLTAKTPGTLLNVAGADNGFDSTTGAGFTVVRSLNVPNSVGLLIAGSVSPNCCGAGFSTVTLTVSANGTNFSKSQGYCNTAPIPGCKLSNGQGVTDGATAFQSIVDQFNSDPNSPVTMSFSFGILVINAKTPGALVAAVVSDDGGSFSSVEVGP